MHLPDGFLAPIVWIPASIATGVTVVYSSRRAARSARSSTGPGATAALAAFVFAAQSLQFPIPGGASGHLLGATLLAVLLGPARAIVAMAAVFTIQAAVFHDGGLTTLGANIWNGGIVPAIAGYGIYRLMIRAFGDRRRGLASGAGSMIGVLAGAFLCSAEVALSGTAPFYPFLGAMTGAHAWIGGAEAFLTAQLVLALAPRLGPSIINDQTQPNPGGAPAAARRVAPATWFALAAIVVISAASVYVSSTAPDGLESAALRLGLPMHEFPPAAHPSAGQALAGGIAGAGAVGLLAFGALLPSRLRWR